MIQRELAKLQASINRNQKKVKEEEKQLNTNRRDSGNTSVDSQMEDTPSNYNLANQRFDHLRDGFVDDVEQIEEEESDSDIDLEGLDGDISMHGEMQKKRRKKKKKLY